MATPSRRPATYRGSAAISRDPGLSKIPGTQAYEEAKAFSVTNAVIRVSYRIFDEGADHLDGVRFYDSEEDDDHDFVIGQDDDMILLTRSMAVALRNVLNRQFA